MDDDDYDAPDDKAKVAEWHTRLEALPHIYRYVGLRSERFAWLCDTVLRSRLFFPKFGQLNDPYDGTLRLWGGGTHQEQRAMWERIQRRQGRHRLPGAREEIDHIMARSRTESDELMWAAHDEEMAKLGVACFSETPKDIRMWAHYAEGQRGVCLRFRAQSLMEPLEDCHPPIPVEYVPEHPTVYFFRDTGFKRSSLMWATKANFWEHESEWRIVRREGKKSSPFPPAALDGIILGCNIEHDDEERVRAMRACRKPELELLRARIIEREFKLEIVPA